jgi:hypothetical protein
MTALNDTEIMQEDPPEPYYNNRIFSDCILCILTPPESQVTNIHVSKFLLASKSQYFFKLFSNSMKESSENKVNIYLEDAYEITHFQDIIRLVYEEPLQTPPEENLHLLYLADKYGLDEAVEKIVDLMKNSNRDSLSNAYTLLEIRHHDSLYARESVKKFLVQPAIDYILENFRRWPKILLHKETLEIFLSIPVDALFLLLESNTIEVDSENSVLLGALLWINAGTKDKIDFPNQIHMIDANPREIHISEIFKRIRFPQMQRYYLLDFVKHLALMEFPQHKTFLAQIRDLSLQFHLQPSRFLGRFHYPYNIFSPRTIKNQEGITITCRYKVPSTSTEGNNNSQPMEIIKKKKIHHGYYWECWLDIEAEDGQPFLFCNIRCFMDIVKEHKFYLPVKVELIITLQAITKRVGPLLWLYEDNLPKKKKLVMCEGSMDEINLEARLCLLEDDSEVI